MKKAAHAAAFFCLKMINYLACKFTKQTLSNLVKECFGADFPFVFDKKQINYIVRYLSDLGAESVLLEKEYLDKDYLEDHARYYVKCYNNNGQRCARLHFFSKKDIGHQYIDNLLAGGTFHAGKPNDAYIELKESYLGFIVIKPLPKTFIGKTCLKRYSKLHDGKDRRISLYRDYKVDLFGLSLNVESIAFQEQDRVVSACATTAIWSALQAITWRDNHEIPACSEITTSALNHIDNSTNSFPNNGLTNKQIMRALDVEGLRHHSELLNEVPPEDFLATVRGYIDSKFPLILGVHVFEERSSKTPHNQGHAITILGYVNDPGEPSIYVHDDRFGPFARAKVVSALPDGRWGLALQRKIENSNECIQDEILVPDILIIPVYKKVRIPFSTIRNTCRLLVEQMNTAAKTSVTANNISESLGSKSPFDAYSYQIHLETISEIRKNLIESEPTSTDINSTDRTERIQFLSGNYARFQWVATFYFDKSIALRMLFDATEIPQGNALSAVLIDNKTLADPLVKTISKLANGYGGNLAPIHDHFYSSVLRHFRKYPESHESHLDMFYGPPRAPEYLKPDEFPNGQIVRNSTAIIFYEPSTTPLSSHFEENENKILWAIGEDGGLILGIENANIGHPSLTGFKPARISGELNKEGENWIANPFSGRYSGGYTNDQKRVFLENAILKMKSFFPKDHFKKQNYKDR